MKRRYWLLWILLASLLLLADTNQSWPPSLAILQAGTTVNTETTSAANTAQTKSIAAVAGKRVYLYSVHCSCSSTTGATLTIKDGVAGTIIWSQNAANGCPVSTAIGGEFIFHTPLASSVGNGMDIVAGTCSTSNTSTLDVQASQF